MEDIYQKIKDHFTKNNVTFKEITHSPGATAEEYHNAVGCKYEQQAKCLLVRAKSEMGKYYAIVAIPAQKRLDLDYLKKELDLKEIRMANKDELRQVTGCNFGEVPPLGSIFNVRLIMDKDFLQQEEIYMNAGRVDISFILHPTELLRLEKPTLI